MHLLNNSVPIEEYEVCIKQKFLVRFLVWKGQIQAPRISNL